MDRKKTLFLGEILIRKNLINWDELDIALQVQKDTRQFLGKILIDKGFISEENLCEALSEQFNLPILDIKNKEIKWELADKLHKSLILEHRCFPIEEDEATVIVIVTNPLDVEGTAQMEKHFSNYQIKKALVSGKDMDGLIEKYRAHLREKLKNLFSGNP